MLWFQALLRPCPSHKKCCEHIGFPTTTKLNSLASPQQRTPWPVFQDGRCNTSPILSYYNVTTDSFEDIHSLRATSGHHYLVSGTFHPPIGVLFSFPSRYFYSIGLETYLELGVDASHYSYPISNGYYSRTIQKLQKDISTGLSPSTVLKFQIEFNLPKKVKK